MKTVDFYELPSDVADRLRWGMRGQFDPKPLLFQAATRPKVWLWLAMSALAALLLVVLWMAGFGQLGSALARQPTATIAAYVVLVGLFAWGILEAIAERVRQKRLPFAAGLYLFGAKLIDARERTLRVFPIEEATEVVQRGDSVVIAFEAKRFVFLVDPAHVERALVLVRQAREHATRGLGRASRYELDPLEAPAIAMPLPPQEDPLLPPPRWPRYAPVLAIGFGLSGVGLFFVRDGLSDDAMFAEAARRDDVTTYEAYLAQGDAHVGEVARTLLPRAALRPAIAAGTVAAIDDFVRAYPDHQIAPEVEKARQAAVAAAFEHARSEGSLTSLASFAATYPDHHLDGPYREAMKSVYRHALEAAQKKMPPDAKQQRALVGELLAWAERVGSHADAKGLRGPAVQIRMHQLPSRAMDRADKLVRINPYYGGDRSLPSTYVDRPHLEPLERASAEAIAAAFAKAFRPELVTFASGSPVEAELSTVEVPTFVVSYRVEPSGQNYASRKPRGIFLGIVVFASVDLFLPGKAEPFETAEVVTERIPVRIIEDNERGEPVEARVYTTMLEGALDQIAKRYLADWFIEPT